MFLERKVEGSIIRLIMAKHFSNHDCYFVSFADFQGTEEGCQCTTSTP